jgi:hypothetical protein
MRGKKAKAMRKAGYPNPGRKLGGATKAIQKSERIETDEGVFNLRPVGHALTAEPTMRYQGELRQMERVGEPRRRVAVVGGGVGIAAAIVAAEREKIAEARDER